MKSERTADRQVKQAPGDAAEREEITGVIESVIYRSEDSGYSVVSVRMPGREDTVTVVGTCGAIWLGEAMKATGRWVRHRQHGFQFQADSIICIAPTSVRGIERFLASGMIKGSGKVMAERMVKAFGEDTLRIIEKESQRLEEVEGIGPKRRKMIKDSWNEHVAVRDIMIFLQAHGVGTAQAVRIYRQYGTEAVALITQNPYRLCSDIWGIGFKTADRVAVSLGIPRDSEIRGRAGIIYTLETMAEEGHCFCPYDELLRQASLLLEIPSETLELALAHELKSRRLVQEEDRIYIRNLHDAEVETAAKIRKLVSTPAAFRPLVVERAIPWTEERMKIRFAPKQFEAIRMALSEKVCIMTGGPGVGKTTIIRALVDAFAFRKLAVRLAAPTGRAAKRMEEATRREAKTIHRLLKYLPHEGHFEFGPDNPLEGDVFILDEVSMIDIQLMKAFVSALPDKACLILVGDVDQLPSVGPGNVLRDLIAAGTLPCTKLETIFRQEAGGWIVQNAHRINRGESLEIPTDDDSDFFFVQSQEPDEVIRLMLELVSNRIPDRFGLDPMNDVQVLTPMRRNQLGAENLNAILQEKLNPSGPELQRFGRHYRLRDRVMQIRNNYDKEVFNGDIGRIVHVDNEDSSLSVDYDGKPVKYGMAELDELVHAYACSVHKSQGSEYPAVVVLMTTQHFKLLQRNLLYTALTRGRKLVCLVGSSKAIHIAIRNNEIRLRRTSLAERLTTRAT